MFRTHSLDNCGGDENGFLRFSVGLHQMDSVAFVSIGKAGLGDSGLILLNQGIGRPDDIPGGPVVLLKAEEPALRIILAEIQDVLDFRSPERIDGLRVVTDHTDVPVPLAEFLQNEVLGEVGVLVLVHENVVEPVCNGGQRVREILEQNVHVQENVIEIHHAGSLAFLRIFRVDIAYFRLFGMGVVDDCLGICLVGGRSDQIVLGHRYAPENILRLIDLVVQMHLLEAGLDGADRVAGVVDREGGRVSEPVRELPEEPYEDGMEGAHVQAAGLPFPYHGGDSLLHFGSGLLGESQCKNAVRLASLLKKICNPARQHPGLSRPGSRHYQYRTFRLAYSRSLLLVQPLKYLSLRSHLSPSQQSPQSQPSHPSAMPLPQRPSVPDKEP